MNPDPISDFSNITAWPTVPHGGEVVVPPTAEVIAASLRAAEDYWMRGGVYHDYLDIGDGARIVLD